MSPIGRKFDFQLGGKGFILPRGSFKGRAWHRTGQSDSPGRRSDTDVKYGELPDEIDHPEVWDDWSGGAFHPYRRTGEPTYHWGENFDARFPRQLIHCQRPQVLDRSFVDNALGAEAFFDMPATATLNDSILMLTNRVPNMSDFGDVVVLRVTGSAVQPISGVGLLGSTGCVLGYRPALFGSWVFIPQLNGSVGFRIGHTFSQYPSIVGKGFANAGNRLWRIIPDGPGGYVLRSLADATNTGAEALWSASLNVGNSSLPIKDVVALDDQLCVGLVDGLYVGDQSGTFFNVLSELKDQIHEDNFRDLSIHRGTVVAAHISGLYTYQNDPFLGVVRSIGPKANSRSPVRGRFRCTKSFGAWLYAGLYTGSISYLLAGDTTKEVPIWHTLQRFGHTTKVHRLHVDGLTQAFPSGVPVPNNMWVATDISINTGGTCPVYFWPIPMQDDNPLGAPSPFSPNYVGSARMDMGNTDFGAPSTPKVYRSVEVWAETLLSGYRYADVYYNLDQSGSFALLGRVQTSPKTQLFFPGGEGSFVTGQSIELSLRSFTASPALTPVYRSVVLRGAVLARSADQIVAVARIADNMRDRHQGTMRSAAMMLAELRGMVGTMTTLVDVSGAVNYVQVLAPIEEQEFYQHGEEEPEIGATVKMAVLVFS